VGGVSGRKVKLNSLTQVEQGKPEGSIPERVRIGCGFLTLESGEKGEEEYLGWRKRES